MWILGLLSVLSASAADVGVRFTRGSGLAVGVLHAPGTWERIGKNPTFGTFSPIISGAAVLDVDWFSFGLELDAAFTYVHHRRDGTLTTGWLTGGATLSAGNDDFRVGPIALFDPFPVGVGLSAVVLPGPAKMSKDGFEVRLTGFWVEDWNLQAMLMYTGSTGRIP